MHACLRTTGAPRLSRCSGTAGCALRALAARHTLVLAMLACVRRAAVRHCAQAQRSALLARCSGPERGGAPRRRRALAGRAAEPVPGAVAPAGRVGGRDLHVGARRGPGGQRDHRRRAQRRRRGGRHGCGLPPDAPGRHLGLGSEPGARAHAGLGDGADRPAAHGPFSVLSVRRASVGVMARGCPCRSRSESQTAHGPWSHSRRQRPVLAQSWRACPASWSWPPCRSSRRAARPGARPPPRRFACLRPAMSSQRRVLGTQQLLWQGPCCCLSRVDVHCLLSVRHCASARRPPGQSRLAGCRLVATL